ncbi:MBL fold metallo-hydrolase [Paraburkholderia kirstenboschensis]|uniref:MBL fold metallo-hydrolase n=1 Tax=Paraburkholderia kirstenboschensis TaxID=1245436 RepID=A0ABZ0E9N7_9BURK|nr:MBL fold metallo-hydrolase [Paraburkholderia kirstenboschensis]WOD13939.1 MBL fold metallo-hydrolase [Paraburkholderia kirstenboschensis]
MLVSMPSVTGSAATQGAVRISVDEFAATLAERLADHTRAPLTRQVVLYWLGQAGFVIDCEGFRMLIDPYLSDSLAEKYRGTRYPHVRMLPAPLAPDDLDRLDLVLCTHRHTDHMDPGTLQPLARRFPALRFVVPAASVDEAIKRCGVGMDRLIPVNAGMRVQVRDDCLVSPIASAHETLEADDKGQHPWLGYVIEACGVRLYHSGDCVPYAELAGRIAERQPDVALLPVNGRDEARSGNGVPGNFTLDEAVELMKEAHVPVMVAHHYGLFDFNTISPEEIDARIAVERHGACELFRAQTQRAWRLVKTGNP